MRQPRRQIWIVDDEDAIRDSLEILLSSYGFVVRGFESGATFLAEACRNCACLILDMAMPGMDGLEVMAAMRARSIHIPTIIVTGHGDSLMRQKVLAAGAMCLLDKPVAEDLLLASIDVALKVAR